MVTVQGSDGSDGVSSVLIPNRLRQEWANARSTETNFVALVNERIEGDAIAFDPEALRLQTQLYHRSLATFSKLRRASYTAPQHLVCRAVQSLHTSHMQMSIIEVFICRRLHMNTSMILICIWLICRLCTALHTKCCGAVLEFERERSYYLTPR